MDDQQKKKDQCLEELRQAREEVARLQKVIADGHYTPESRYKAALEAMPQMMFWFDYQGIFIDYKAATDQDLYIPPEVFMGKQYKDVLPPPVSAPLEQTIELVRQTGKPQVFRYALDYPDGTRFFDARVSIGADNLIFSSIDDVTRIAKAEAAIEQEHSRTENLYRQILDSISDMILVKGPKSKIVWGNKAFRDVYGMTNEQLQGMIDAPIVDPDYTQKYVQDDEYVFLNAKTLFIQEEPITRHDGTVIPAQTVKSPVFDQDGNVIMTVGVSRDITEAKRAAEAAENQRRILQAVLDNMPAGVFMVEAPSGHPILSNKRAEEFLGRGISPHAVGDGLSEVYQAYKYGTDELYPAEEMPIVAGMFGQNKSITDMEVRRPDGSRVLLEVNGAPVFDANGKVAASVVVFLDVTERRKLEETVEKEREQLSDAMQAAKMVYWEMDWLKESFTFNDEFYASLGTTAEAEGGYEMPATTYSARFIPPEETKAIGDNVERIMTTEDPKAVFQLESRIVRKDGEVRWVMVRQRVVKDDQGRIVRTYGANQDITDQKLAQQTIAKRAAELTTVSQLATSVATIQDPDEMLQTVVDLVKQDFALYHAHVYLADEASGNLVLARGAGDVGRQMAAEGRQIAMTAEKSLVARAARTRQGVIVNNVHQDPEFLPHPLLPDTHSEMAVPMIAGDHLLGVLDVQSEIEDRFSTEDVMIQMTLAAQVAVALQNARQYSQVQDVLIDNRKLYQQSEHRAAVLQKLTDIQSALSRATNEDEIVTAVSSNLQLGDQLMVTLGFVDEDEIGAPEKYTTKVIWQNGQVLRNVPGLEQSVEVKGSPLAAIWADHPDQVQIIANWRVDDRFHESSRQWMEQFGGASLVIIPMHSGGHWHATLAIFWPDLHEFQEDEVFLLKQLREPLAAVVASRRAYLAEEQALAEAETLYHATSQMARSHTFDEVLQAIVQNSCLKSFDMAALQFFNTPWRDRAPESVTSISIWEREAGLSPYQLGAVVVMKDLSFWEQIRRQPYVLITDPENDTKLHPVMRKAALATNWRTSLTWRLVIGEEWVGNLSAASKADQVVTETDIRRLSTLVEQAGTVIQSLQLLEQIQKALNETANLYMASRRLNEATSLQDMVAAVAEGLHVPDINRALLVFADQPESGEVKEINIVATWHSGSGAPVTPAGIYHPQDVYRTMPLLFSPEPVFISDVHNDPRTGASDRAMYEHQQVEAFAILPLRLGSRQTGVLLLQSENVHEFTEEENRTYQALARQLAISVESRRLYEETQQRIRRERVLREITARVRGSMDPDAILQTAVRELGSALGRPAFVRLGSAEQLAQKPEDKNAGNEGSPVNVEGGK